ncbi:MAG: twin-arginine translocation signal domain-containing protein [Proteobacteria bacterium]|nr:twin-arginine translocation signal domain-containing protein [Pseudomonadota bacterium]
MNKSLDKKVKKEVSRRNFLKTAGKATIVAPAAAVILSAALKPQIAQAMSGEDKEMQS